MTPSHDNSNLPPRQLTLEQLETDFDTVISDVVTGGLYTIIDENNIPIAVLQPYNKSVVCGE